MHMETRQMEVGAGVVRIRRSRGEYVRISERPSRRNRTNAPSLADECILFPQSGIGMQSAWKTLAGLAHSWIRTSPKAKPVKVQSPGSGKPLIIVLSANLFERRRICSSLDRKRYDVIEAANAPEALAAARNSTVELLIIDVIRPGMGGRQMLRLLGLPESIKVLLVADYPEFWPFAPGDDGTEVMGKQISADSRRARIQAMLPPAGGQRPILSEAS